MQACETADELRHEGWRDGGEAAERELPLDQRALRRHVALEVLRMGEQVAGVREEAEPGGGGAHPLRMVADEELQPHLRHELG